MIRSPRFPHILAAVLLVSGCVQSLAPTGVGISGAAPSATPLPLTTRPTLVTVANATLMSHDLAIPVAGIASNQLEDSFDASRDGERFHHAIDIMAPRGTPVLAADDGRVLRVSSNTLGGLTVYTIDKSGQYVYYYAHLEGYARGLVAGNIVFKGDTLGFVGTTGDAPENEPHLHFQILRMPPDGKYWNGDAIDPFPLLSERGAGIVGH